MDFDDTVARQLIEQVAQRAASPTALDDLSSELASALKALTVTEAKGAVIASQIEIERTTGRNATATAETLTVEAESRLAQASQHENTLADRLAGLVSGALAEIATQEDRVAALALSLATERTHALESLSLASTARDRLLALLDASEARTTRYRVLLDDIASMPWWRAAHRASQTANDAIDDTN